MKSLADDAAFLKHGAFFGNGPSSVLQRTTNTPEQPITATGLCALYDPQI